MSFDLPSLPEGWCYSSLGQLAQDKSITYGVVQPGSIVEDGVPIVRVNNIRDGRIELADVMKIAPEIESKYLRTRLNGGEVLITIVGSVGQVAIVPESLKGFNIARAVAVIHPREDVSPQWLAICLRSPLSQHLLGSRANTTVQTTINLKDLRELPVPMPPIAERQKIEELIYFLDDRIALLRETNATLEAIAQALFKSWFVDFDPVHAKARGEPPQGMDNATAALFPDSFEESELGMIPKGWRVGSIYDIASVIYGAPFASKKFNTENLGIPLIRIRDLKSENPGVYTEEIHPKGYLVQPGDLVVGMDGEFRAYIWGGTPAWLNQRVCVFMPKGDYSSAYVNYTIKPQLASVEATETATTVIHLGKNDIDHFKSIIPDTTILKLFSEITSPIYSKIVEGKLKAQTLAQLRDTLLPKLISGQLRLPEAETLLAEELP